MSAASAKAPQDAQLLHSHSSPRVDKVNPVRGVPGTGAGTGALPVRLAVREGVHGVAVVPTVLLVGLHPGQAPGGQKDARPGWRGRPMLCFN